jgi:tape measure domain-containing protein
MALNMDTALRIVAKVSGLNEFKALTDSLQNVEGASKNAGSGLQQTANESNRVSQEASKTAATVKAQAVALQNLQSSTRASAAEMRRMGAETSGLGGVLQRLRGQSGGVLDGLSGSTVKAANNIRVLQQSIQPTEGQIAKLRGEMLQLGASSKQTERSLEQQVAALKTLRSQAEINGGVYQALSGDIAKLQAASKGIDASSAAAAGGLKRVAAASAESGDAIRQQIQSLTALQASLKGSIGDTGAAAQQLQALKRRAAELGQAWEPGIRGLKLLAQESAKSVDAQSGNMTRLQGVLSKAGEGYQRLGREIDSVRQKAARLDLSKGLNITPGNVASGVGGAVRSIFELRRELSKTAPGRVALVGEGLAAAGVAGGVASGAASGLGSAAGGAQAVASSLDAIAAKAAALPAVLKPLGGLLSEPASAAAAGIGQWANSLTAAQAKLQALAIPFEGIRTAIEAIGPETAAAFGVGSLAVASFYQLWKSQADRAQADMEASFKGISDEAQKAYQDLIRMYDRVPNARLEAQQQLLDRNRQRLGEVPVDSVEARRAANAVVTAEREIEKIKAAQNQLVERARQQQADTTTELQKQITASRGKIAAAREELSLAERVAAMRRRADEQRREIQARPEREALVQQQSQMEALRNQARTRLELQQQQTAAVKAENQALAEQRAIRGSIRRNQERVVAEQSRAAAADADLRRRAAEAFAPSRVLALPAAGQSSFQGRVDAEGRGGRARPNLEVAGTRDDIGAAMASRSAQAMQQQAQATQRTRGALAELFLTIDRVTKASNGSINSLQRQRSAWQALQNAVNPAAPAYAKATAQVQRLDQQLTKLTGTQEKAERASIGREAIGGALGTLATGGGLQGAAGALAGGLAFSGGAGGIVAGAAVAAIGGAAALAARVGVEAETAQVRLKALTDQFGEYNQAQASAARIAATLRISQVEASDGFSKLYAALRPTGITLQEIEDAFVGFTAAARTSGATAEESSAALQQLKQALGSGILQGDELRSIREQAPAVGQAIAKEMGVTIGELKKLGEQGKITTDVVIRALAKLRGEKLGQLQEQFNTSAQAVKDLQVATQNFGLTVARVFGPSTVAAIRGVTAALEAANQTFGAMTGNQGAQQAIQDRLRARQQAERDTNARPFGLLDFGGRQQFFRQREEQLFQQFQQQRTTSPDAVSPTQQQARDAAAGERNTARARAAAEEGKKSAKEAKDLENDLAKIRLDSERRLAEFREQSIKRAGELEKDLARQRLDLERSTAEARRQIENQRRDAELETRRQQLGAAGLSTAGIDERRLINEERQRFTERQLQIEERATDRKVEIERAVEDYKVSVAEGIRDILVDASEKMAENMQKGAAMAGGVIARTGNTGQSTGPHLDARWSDGRRISAADADRYLSVNGRNPSSFGVTSGYGPRSLFGRSFHKGIDFGTPSGSGISLKGGASLLRDLGFTGAGGYAVEIDTPQGRMRLLHLQAGSAARPSGAPARASAAIATGPAPGMDRIEGGRRDLMAALGQNTAAQTGANFGELIGGNSSAISRITGDLDQQKASAKEQLADFQRMVELQRSGLSPEIAKQRVDLERMAEVESTRLSERKKEIEDQLNITGLTAENRRLLEGQLAMVQARLAAQPEIINGLTAEQQQLERLQASYERNKQLADGVANTIGGGLSSAMNLLIEGTDNWGESLKQIAAGVLQDIAKQLIQIFVIEAAISALRGVFSSIGGGGGGKGGGGLNIADMQKYSNFATGGIMTNVGPLPLKRYAVGGVANSPQVAMFGERGPEAYVPLPDGRSIPVKLKSDQRANALDRYRPAAAGGGMTTAGDTFSSETAPMGSSTIDVRYQSEIINNVEYVTAEQFQQGMRQAAAQGAQRGERQALRSLQQSTAVRRRVGIR